MSKDLKCSQTFKMRSKCSKLRYKRGVWKRCISLEIRSKLKYLYKIIFVTWCVKAFKTFIRSKMQDIHKCIECLPSKSIAQTFDRFNNRLICKAFGRVLLSKESGSKCPKVQKALIFINIFKIKEHFSIRHIRSDAINIKAIKNDMFKL